MMKHMTVQDAISAVQGEWIGQESVLLEEIKSVEIDSRKVQTGTLFVAIPGERVDGHKFIPGVLENGAVCAISEQRLEESIQNYILVNDTKTALRDLAEYYRGILDIKIVGITGSVGKTSTKEMIATVLSEKFSVQKTAGNFNNEIGLPLTIFSIGTEHEIGVVEMGISDFGEMSRLAKIARPDVMVITNIGQCHLENLGTRDGILKAKTECFDYLNSGAQVVLNGNDDKLVTIETVQGTVPNMFVVDADNTGITFCNQKVCASAKEISSLGLAGSDCTMTFKDLSGEVVTSRVHIPVAGSHMVYNALAASMVGLLFGMNVEEIVNGIGKATAVSGRGRLIKTGKYLLVDDTYNANPVSMRAELDLLKESEGRRVAILGDMFELGDDEVQMHYDLGAYAITCCDELICIGELSKNMHEGAGRGYYFATKEEFLKVKEDILMDGDTILLKASHGMQFGLLLEELK